MPFPFKSLSIASVSAFVIASSTSVFAAESAAQSLAQPVKQPSVVVKHYDANHVMAVIDGKQITAKQLDDLAANLNPNLTHLPIDKRRLATLQLYINSLRIAHAAVEAGLDKSPSYTSLMEIARNSVLQKIYFQKEIMDKISSQDIKKRYEKEIANLPKEEEVHARHILVKTKEQAQALIARLNKGENFEEIAKKSSTDGSAAVGGDLGYFTHGQMVEPFEKAAFALKVGQYTKQPVETPFGWHIIKVEDRRQKRPPALSDVKDAIESMIARDRYQETLKALSSKVKVHYPDAEVGKILEQAASDSEDTDNGDEDD